MDWKRTFSSLLLYFISKEEKTEREYEAGRCRGKSLLCRSVYVPLFRKRGGPALFWWRLPHNQRLRDACAKRNLDDEVVLNGLGECAIRISDSREKNQHARHNLAGVVSCMVIYFEGNGEFSLRESIK